MTKKTTPRKPRAGSVRFGPESLERMDPSESARSRAAGDPSGSKPLQTLRRCPFCKQRAATELIEPLPGLVHLKVCAPCAAKFHAGARVFGVLKTFF